MSSARLIRRQAHPIRISGPIIEAVLPGVTIGEVCEIRDNVSDKKTVARAQVLGFNNEHTVLSLIGHSNGLSRESVISPTGSGVSVNIGDHMLGSVVDPMGNVVERLVDEETVYSGTICPIDNAPPSYENRLSIQTPFFTGIRAIDGLMTCGIGQRLGIFASAGCGKTTLMHMLIGQSQADVFVIGLIGERGREVTEFVDSLRKSSRKANCVLVYATSDFSSLDRCNAALLATTISEFFRDQGKRVVLFLDSITRYARALRDTALASGEAPARRGYPASVFDNLPRVLERPGLTKDGSITAFYTILLEGDDEPDPIADEIRSILDGHIYLDSKLAAQNHYPAIDILHSVSRVSNQVCNEEHLHMAGEIRKMLAKIKELKIFLEIGEYTLGENAENDRAIGKMDALTQWLRQSLEDKTEFDMVIQGMEVLAS